MASPGGRTIILRKTGIIKPSAVSLKLQPVTVPISTNINKQPPTSSPSVINTKTPSQPITPTTPTIAQRINMPIIPRSPISPISPIITNNNNNDKQTIVTNSVTNSVIDMNITANNHSLVDETLSIVDEVEEVLSEVDSYFALMDENCKLMAKAELDINQMSADFLAVLTAAIEIDEK